MLTASKSSHTGRAVALAALVALTSGAVATVQGCSKAEDAPALIKQEGTFTDHTGKTSKFVLEARRPGNDEFAYAGEATASDADLAQGRAFAEAPADYFPQAPLTTADRMPSFDGDLAGFLFRNIKYPEAARKAGIQGRVVVRFIVGEDGTVRAPQIVKGVDPALDAEALRAVKAMPRWHPGADKGKPVAVYYNGPISFRLS